MRHCGRCDQDLEPDEFHLKAKWCKPCCKVYQADYYQRRKAEGYFTDKNKRLLAASQARLREILRDVACVDCGESDIVCLHFDHVSGVKTISISLAIRSLWSEARLMSEVEKCVIRCANCHMKKTARDFNWAKLSWNPN